MGQRVFSISFSSVFCVQTHSCVAHGTCVHRLCLTMFMGCTLMTKRLGSNHGYAVDGSDEHARDVRGSLRRPHYVCMDLPDVELETRSSVSFEVKVTTQTNTLSRSKQ